MQAEVQRLIRELEDLYSEMINLANQNRSTLARVCPENQTSATNLLHYLALRRHDVRGLQEQLADLGLSSLGRTEPHVLNGVRTVMKILAHLHPSEPASLPDAGHECDRDEGHRLLVGNTDLLLGPEPEGRKVRIMVTMPSAAATNYGLVRDLVSSGMNCMRINCAHDGEEAWSRMIRNLRQAEQETGRRCKIEMDLAGPKLRTGPMERGPSVLKIHPARDAFGRMQEPARVWLTPAAHPENPPSPTEACIRVPGRWLASLAVDDHISFVDTRGARRSMTVTGTVGKSCWAEAGRTAYIAPGTVLAATSRRSPEPRRTHVGPMSPKPQYIVLRPGDTLVLTRSLDAGHPAQLKEKHEVVRSARIGVTLPEFFDSVKSGQPIWLDDGKIGGIISEVGPDEVVVEITHAKSGGDKLGAEKGINLPETDLITPSLTSEDLTALNFVAKNADIVGYSFVRKADDVRQLQAHLKELGAENLGVVLKIETREGFDNLPSLLLAALEQRSVGVMIARGDLAIECGYQRLAEAQEEILWISEAAHVPVVWATQVLESLAKTGTPSRSEITDAAMGERAECVMLNKGPFVVDAVRTLDDILRRMQDHQEKKRSMMRKLGVAAGFDGGDLQQPSTP